MPEAFIIHWFKYENNNIKAEWLEKYS